jgi:hypothetical protein
MSVGKQQLFYGGVPVPYVASWTAEERIFLAPCPHAGGRLALCEEDHRGQGKPRFGKPHMGRQREAIAHDLCDLCGKSLRGCTKVGLSHAQPVAHAVRPGDILQVEPLMHRECAAVSAEHCPSLKRDIRSGTLMVRQVFRHRAQFAIYSEQGVFEACGVRQIAVSHAKVQLLKWKDRDLAWLEAS